MVLIGYYIHWMYIIGNIIFIGWVLYGINWILYHIGIKGIGKGFVGCWGYGPM